MRKIKGKTEIRSITQKIMMEVNKRICLEKIVRAPRKAPSICYYPMKTLFEYKDKGMLFFFEILEAQ